MTGAPYDKAASLEKGLMILRELATSERDLGAGPLAKRTGLNRATVYRLCEILERRDWIREVIDDESGERRFNLGPSVLGMAVLITSKYSYEERLEPLLHDLAESVGETVHVAIREDAEVVHIARALPRNGLSVAAPIGSRELAHVTGLGKALLSTLSDAEIKRLYPREELPVRTSRALSNRGLLLDALNKVADTGYAVENEESRDGIACIAAPVFDQTGRASFAISVSAPPPRLMSRLDEVAGTVKATTALLSQSIGGVPRATWTR
jgi:IclR family acetate operon transcriptional repressor